MQSPILQLDASDNVLIALTDLKQNQRVSFSARDYVLQSDIPAKHKFAIRDLAPGDPVVMYGVLVGKAVARICCGEIISTRNIHHETAAFHEERQTHRLVAPE